MNTLFQDIRYGVRGLLKRPASTAIALLILALGIGANSAIFSVVYGVLIRALPYPQPERLVTLHWQRGSQVFDDNVTGYEADFLEQQFIAKDTGSIDSLTIAERGVTHVNLMMGKSAHSISSLKIGSTYFKVLGVAPLLGRGFTSEEDRPGGPAVAILSHSLWVSGFGANPNLVGTIININGMSYQVVGIMPAGFESYPASSIYLPLQLSPDDPNYVGTNYVAIARLAHGVALQKAQAQLAGLSFEYKQLHPNDQELQAKGSGFILEDYRDAILNGYQTRTHDLILLQMAVGFVLLIACTNLASLRFARGNVRRREVLIRIALGGSRARILRMFMVENLLLALLGGALGLVLAFAAVPLLIAASPVSIPRTQDIHAGGTVVLFSLCTAVATVFLFGLAPALALFRNTDALGLAQGNTIASSRHQAFAGRVLMIVQTAVALVLLAGATLMFRSFLKIVSVSPGFDIERLLTFEVSLTATKYQTTASTQHSVERILERIRSLPGVESAAYTSGVPLKGGINLFIVPAGRDPHSVSFATEFRSISTDYFQALKSPLLEGRAFNENDTGNSPPVVIINQTLARRWWLNSNPIGQRLVIEDFSLKDRLPEIVGVVADLHEASLQDAPEPMVLAPYTQINDKGAAFTNRIFPAAFLIRTTDNVGLGTQIHQIVSSIDPQVPVLNIRSAEQVMDLSLASPRFFDSLFAIFAGFALFLMAIGIYGLFSYLVAQKTREIGIRIAIGASRSRVLRLILREAALVAGAGMLVGVFVALAVTRFLQSLLFEVRPTDPLALTGSVLILAAVAILAAFLPARRAMKVDPVVALRYE